VNIGFIFANYLRTTNEKNELKTNEVFHNFLTLINVVFINRYLDIYLIFANIGHKNKFKKIKFKLKLLCQLRIKPFLENLFIELKCFQIFFILELVECLFTYFLFPHVKK
jgi:hypothetical protein